MDSDSLLTWFLILHSYICFASGHFDVDMESTLTRWGVEPPVTINNNGSHRRVARQLIDFPDFAVFKTNFKLVVPHWSDGDAKAKGDYRVEITFQLPDEIRRRKKRSFSEDQATIYSMLSDGLSKSGMDGETCIQRTICELAEKPFFEYGIFGDFINLIFSPGFHTDENTEEHMHAEDYGRAFGGCWAAFPHCPFTMRDVILDFLKDNSNIQNSL